MSPNNNLNVLPWYTNLSQQNGNKWYAFGNVWPLVMPAGRLIPFQLVVPYTGVTVSGFSIINIETNAIYNGPTASVSVVSRGSYTVIKMSGGSVTPTRLGRYYAKLTLSNGQIYYSEVFTFVDNISDYIKLQYWNDDNLYYNGGEINYENNFKFEMYLCTTIGKPEYQFEEEVTKRLGYKFPELQISNKVYKFTCVAPEFICDALRLVRLSDYIHITSEDDTYNALSFAYEAKWETQGDLASVEAEFETDNIIQKLESFNRRVRDSFYNALLTDTDVPFKFDESSIAQYYKDYMLTAENSNFINGKLIRELVSGEAITDTTYIAVDYGAGAAKKLNLKTVLSSIDTGFNVNKMWEELGKDNASKLIHPSHIGLLHKLFTPLDKAGNEVAYNDSTTEIKSIRANYDFWGVGAVSAKGLSAGGGGGTGGIVQTVYGFTDLGGTFSDSDLNNTFNAYTINEIWKLANKGGLSDFSISGTGNAITNVEKAADGKSLVFKKDTVFATKAEFDTLNNKFNDFLTGSDTDDIINKWSELEVFLQGMKESDNLATILNGKMDKDALNRLFTALDAAGNEVDINDTTKTITTIRANYGLWSVDFVSAKGISAGGGGTGGASALYQLVDVLANSDNTGVSGAAAGKALVFDGTHWKAGDAGLNESQLATYLTTNGYLKQVTADGKYLAKTEAANLYVAKTQKIIAGTGLSGGGALSGDVTLSLGTSGVTAGTYTKVTVDTYGRVTAGANLAAADIPSLDWSKITTGKPTTLAGYGITDAYTKAEADGKYVTLNTTQTITGVKTFANAKTDVITLKRTVAGAGAFIGYHANNNDAEYWLVGMGTSKSFQFSWGPANVVAAIGTTGTVSASIFNASNALQVGDAYIKWDATNNAVYVVKKDGTTPVGFYATSFVSAKGVSAGGGSTSSNYLVDLLDTSISNPTNGQALVYNSSTQKWVNGTINSFNTSQMWTELAKADASKKIDLSHFPTLFTALTSTSVGNLTVTVGGVTKVLNDVYARYLANLHPNIRPTTANVSFGDGTVRNFKATSTMTTGKPTEGDSHILHMAWDNTGGYDGQLSLPTNPAKSMSWRTQSSGAWSNWVKILDSSNYSGVLDNRYVTLTTAQTITGVKTFAHSGVDTITLKRTVSNGGAYVKYIANNNTTEYWRAGMLNTKDFLFEWGDTYLVQISTAGTITSKAAQGTKPIAVTSTTLCNNLNADLLDGYDSKSFIYYRDNDFDPATYDGYYMGMTTKSGISSDWWHIISTNWGIPSQMGVQNQKEWSSQLALPTKTRTGLRYRTGQNATTYNSWITVLDTTNYTNTLDSRYVKKAGDTMTGTLNINIPNNNSNLIINSTSSVYWSYLRLNNGANFWDIATKQSNPGLEFRLNGADTIKWVINTAGELSSYGKGEIYLRQSSATSTQFIKFQGGDNDYGRIAFGATASNAGWMEIASADDGTEPIYARQYTGTFNAVKNTLVLMDANGDTAISNGKCLWLGGNSRQVRTTGMCIHGGADVVSSTDANLRFGSWNGIGWYPTISGFPVTQGNNAMWLNARYGNLDVAGRFKSNVATGTAPYQCNSTTVNTNLNADLLDNFHAYGLSSQCIIKYGYSVNLTSPAWSRIAKYSIPNREYLTDVCFLLHSAFSNRFAILVVRTRGTEYIEGQLMNSFNIDISKIRIYYSDNKTAVELYYYGGERYSIICAQLLYSTNRDGYFNSEVTMYGSNTTAPSWSNYINPNIASLQNNVASATKLQTARTIWGQSFDGTANVYGTFDIGGGRFKMSYTDDYVKLQSYNSKPLVINTEGNSVGIGTSSPSQKLHVNGNIQTLSIYASDWLRSTGNTGWYNHTYGGGWYMVDSTYIRNYNAKRLRIQTDTYDTIQVVRTSSTGGSSIAFYNNGGTYRGSFGCTANSWFSFDTGTATANQNVVEISTAGGIHSKAEITAKASGSDIRLKKDIQAFHAMGIIHKFRSVKYHWNDIAKANSEVYNNDYWQFGLIAQDLLAGGYGQWVRDVFHDYYTIAYERLIPVVWKGLQEVDSEVIRLRRRVEQLEKELYELKKTA